MLRSMVSRQILMVILLPLVSVSSFSQNELAQLPLGENTLFDFSYISQKFSFLFALTLLLYSILHRGDYEYLNFQKIRKFHKYIYSIRKQYHFGYFLLENFHASKIHVYRPGGLSSKFHNQLLARDSAAIWCSGFQPDSLSEDPDFRRAMELYFMEMLGLQVNWGF